MSRLGAILACAVLLGARPGNPRQQQMFRSRLDLVLVNAAVLSHGSVVRGLSAPDFEVQDNGVPQAVQLVEGKMPVDVTVLAEASPLTRTPQQFWSAMDAAQRQLNADDRISLLTFSVLVHQDVAPTLPPLDLSRQPVEYGGEPRLYDALAQALMLPGSRVASHVIVVYTDGIEIRSVLQADSVVAISAKSDARVIAVVAEINPTAKQYVHIKPSPILKKLTDATDGRLIKPGQLASTFISTLADIRESYLLGFVPKGVAAKGWHTITVKVTRPEGDKYTVRARRGYFGG